MNQLTKKKKEVRNAETDDKRQQSWQQSWQQSEMTDDSSDRRQKQQAAHTYEYKEHKIDAQMHIFTQYLSVTHEIQTHF